MLKPPTGEPCAGEPHARFGGRGESILFPTPIIPPALLVAADFAREIPLAAAVKWFEMGKVSQSKAAELSGLSRQEFLDELYRFNEYTPSKPLIGFDFFSCFE